MYSSHRNESAYIVIKTVRYWHKTEIYTSGTRKKDSPEINPCTFGHLIFDKGGKNIQWREVSSISGAGKTGQLHGKE